MLILYAGYPGKQTDGLHQWLFENPEVTESLGLAFPTGLTRAGDLAHHAVADEIRSSAYSMRYVPTLIEFVANSDARRILVSSENFFHCLTGAPYLRLYRALIDLRKTRRIKLVVSLPPIDALIQSLYLHAIRQGEQIETFDLYLRKRLDWGLELLWSIEHLKKSCLLDEVCVMSGRKAQETDLVQALTLPQSVAAQIRSRAEDAASFGPKAYSTLLFLDQLNEKMGLQLNREIILRSIRCGALELDDKGSELSFDPADFGEKDAQYSLLSENQRLQLLDAMSLVLKSDELRSYSEFLPVTPQAARSFVRLSLDNLSKAGRRQLGKVNHGCNKALRQPTGRVQATMPSSEVKELLKTIAASTDKIPEQAARIDGPLVIFNENGCKPPLFWCFNNWAEPIILANRFGPDQPIVAMRSLHRFAKGKVLKSRFGAEMATAYCDQILERLNLTPTMIGGNCQAAPIASGMAHILAERAESPPLLITLEHYPEHAYPGNILLLFGRKSLKYNPPVHDINPAACWAQAHGALAWGLLNAGHGRYFTEPGINDLSYFIKTAAEDFCESGRIQQGKWIMPAPELCA